MSKQLTFEGVKGYVSYANAVKRGNEVGERVAQVVGPREDWRVRWVVIALPNGRFAPCFMVGDIVSPSFFIGEVNVCCMN